MPFKTFWRSPSRRRILILLALWSGLCGACAVPQSIAAERGFLNVSLEFVDEYQLTEKEFANTRIGGLSAIAYDPAYQAPRSPQSTSDASNLNDLSNNSSEAEPQQSFYFYALSDDRSDYAPARFYTLKIKFKGMGNRDRSADPESDRADQKPGFESISVEQVTFLKDESGNVYAQGTIDPEGFAISPRQTVFISSEGVTNDRVDPFVGEFDLATGQLRQYLPLPSRYLVSSRADSSDRPDISEQADDPVSSGVQNNLGFEALTLVKNASSDPFRVFVATENALFQDQAPEANAQTQDAAPDSNNADSTNPKFRKTRLNSRLIHFAIGVGKPFVVSEHMYVVEPEPIKGGNGLVEILALDRGGHFLSLERAYYVDENRLNGKIFQIAVGGANDVSAIESLGINLPGIQPISKKLVFDMQDLGIRIDNVEGMTLGPHFADGSPSLIVVSDNNFNDRQVTQFLLFKLNITN
jgi:hypothetical protein